MESNLPARKTPVIKLSALSAIYLIWGAIASLNDLLIPYLKREFDLSFSQAMRVQLVFYAAYFFLSIPCGMWLRRYGYRTGILTGLLLAITGCLLMAAGSFAGSYGFILGALFVLASGITMLQVSANPYATSLGPEKTAASRLTLVQSFHSLGTTIGPYFGAILIFSSALLVTDNALIAPYTLLAVFLFMIALLFARLESGPVSSSRAAAGTGIIKLIRTNPRLLLGTIGIFFYVGAEISIGSFLVNYLSEDNVGALNHETAGKFVAVYWGCALVGRFVGSFTLRIINARRLLVFHALLAASLVMVSINSNGALAMWSILLVGFFNSIMFPTIFALTIREVKHETQSASGVLCLGIVGGAVISQLQGILADHIGIQLAFLLPVLCYVYIALYALTALGGKASRFS
jgi:FHS family L-fucose permease-like MFS transporter